MQYDVIAWFKNEQLRINENLFVGIKRILV